MLEQGVDILYKISIFKIVSFDKVNAFADVNLLVCGTATTPSTVSSKVTCIDSKLSNGSVQMYEFSGTKL